MRGTIQPSRKLVRSEDRPAHPVQPCLHGPIQHNVDMEAYDAELLAAGFEFTDDEDEDEVELDVPGRA